VYMDALLIDSLAVVSSLTADVTKGTNGLIIETHESDPPNGLVIDK
jgi:hypothetical protein